jgi:hypothetical protein
MMKCSKCHRSFDEQEPRCPHCDEPNPAASGLFQTSTVLIAAGSAHKVYRSVEEVPVKLRSKLLKSTNGANSATILIADRRGRKQIAKAMRNLPSHAQRRLMSSILGAEATSSLLQWMTPARKRGILAVLILLTLALVGIVFGHRWQ